MYPRSSWSSLAARQAQVVAFVVVAFHASAVVLVAPSDLPLFSNLAQLAASLFAAACCFRALRWAHGYVHDFWLLAGGSFSLWSIAQVGWMYYEVVEGVPVPSPSPVHVLMFFAFAPMALALVLCPYEERKGIDWQQTLDFIQVGIVLLAAYLFFFHIPLLWETHPEQLARERVFLFVTRNALLTLGFSLYAWLTPSPQRRRLFRLMAMFLAAYTLASFAPNYATWVLKKPLGYWTEIAWTLSFAGAAVAITAWRPMQEARQPRRRRSGIAAVLAVYFLPAMLPLLVLFMAGKAMIEQVAVAVVAVVASFLCYSARLAVTQYRQQRSREALEQAEEKFHRLFSGHPQPMCVLEPGSGAFVEVNEAATRLYGYSRDEFLKLSVGDLHPDEDRPRFQQVISSPCGTRQRALWRHCSKDGRVLDVEVTLQDLQFAGRPGRLMVAQDVTERKLLEAQFRQAQKMEAVGTLAGGIAHDFNNLLTVISGYSYMLSEALQGDHKLVEDVQQIEQAAEKAAALTRQLLAFSRRQVLQPKTIALNDVVRGMEKMLRRVIGEDVELITAPAADLGLVRADQGQIEQVIMNLAVNARDAMPQGGKLVFETDNVKLDEAYVRSHMGSRAGSYVQLAVSDTGMGMDAETLSHIFEPFFTTKEMGRGTGLGLSTVYGIVKQSGGYIWVYSELGHGTTFKIYLPRIEEELEEVTEQPQEAARHGSSTILLVEDDEALRELATRILRQHGYTVLPASGGAEAELLCRRFEGTIHLLLSDVVMPGMSGAKLARRLRRQRPDIRVLFISGYTDNAILQHGILKSTTAFLQKPFTANSLADKVANILEAQEGEKDEAWAPLMAGFRTST